MIDKQKIKAAAVKISPQNPLKILLVYFFFGTIGKNGGTAVVAVTSRRSKTKSTEHISAHAHRS